MTPLYYKGKTGNKWVKGLLIRSGGGDIWQIQDIDDPSTIHTVEQDSIRLASGLYDGTAWGDITAEEEKEWLSHHRAEQWRGREICEGDIVTNKWCFMDGFSVVRFGAYRHLDAVSISSGDYGFYLEHVTGARRISYRNNMLYFEKNCIVVGNIYDNPQLLEDEWEDLKNDSWTYR